MEADRSPEVEDLKDVRQYILASVWLRKDRLKNAEAGFRKTLQLNPGHAAAMVDIGALLLDAAQYREAEVIFKKAWKLLPIDSRCHRGLLESLSGQDALAKAFQYYQLKRRNDALIDIEPHDVLCCSAIRNEVDRLPFLTTIAGWV